MTTILRAALSAMAAHAVNVALAFLLLFVWLALTAIFDAENNETDAHMRVEQISNQLAAESVATKGQ